MQFRLMIDMDNVAFDECPGTELARILEGVAKRIEDSLYGELLDADRSSQTLRDINGNPVGNWIVQTRDDIRGTAAR